MSDWTPIENTYLAIPTTNMTRNLFAHAYPDRADEFDAWLKKTEHDRWQDGHDTALINGQSENPYEQE